MICQDMEVITAVADVTAVAVITAVVVITAAVIMAAVIMVVLEEVRTAAVITVEVTMVALEEAITEVMDICLRIHTEDVVWGIVHTEAAVCPDAYCRSLQ